ncbi:DUF6985 domain-containing protein [Clostridium estertheticum]|uniref:DUF6985 domain-containing protein n=1 Tax=Clostridium estertheticum subsp. estertheticum TaxID=1552 RepID=A0A1J0GG30_9CLOT|nr:hypothetical protein [Clostridium estertheticum]APC40322.1 hypothetical protein A7L45_09720 [Clostridium estertheticum subsp. estertheticum]MBU3174295.1 hypothetical protein [Clostridium estertheticum]MBZ9617862.1 hypothetical protein [Clostridium estertheticum subsp. laramiense]WAG73526.1 hypothetical protein LL032_20760 [Clostridium estertheticum]
MKKIIDSVFGELEVYDLGWRKGYSINIFGEHYDVLLTVDGEDRIMEEQKKSYQIFEKSKNKYLSTVEGDLFKYYLENIKEIRKNIEAENYNIEAPVIENKDQFKKLIKPREIIIPEYIDEDTTTFAITFDCTWVGDHTLVIRFDNDDIEIGTEEIIF